MSGDFWLVSILIAFAVGMILGSLSLAKVERMLRGLDKFVAENNRKAAEQREAKIQRLISAAKKEIEAGFCGDDARCNPRRCMEEKCATRKLHEAICDLEYVPAKKEGGAR